MSGDPARRRPTPASRPTRPTRPSRSKPDEQEAAGARGPARRLVQVLPALRQGHPLGSTAEGTVEGFSSHGAYVIVGGVRSYIPLAAMGDPAPNAARQVLDQGETREFVIDGIDWEREGLDLAMPGFESDEAKAAPKQKAPLADESAAKRRRRFGRRRKDE